MPNAVLLKDKFREFIKYFCRENNIDFNFYGAFLEKKKISSIKLGREKGKNKDVPLELGEAAVNLGASDRPAEGKEAKREKNNSKYS